MSQQVLSPIKMMRVCCPCRVPAVQRMSFFFTISCHLYFPWKFLIFLSSAMKRDSGRIFRVLLLQTISFSAPCHCFLSFFLTFLNSKWNNTQQASQDKWLTLRKVSLPLICYVFSSAGPLSEKEKKSTYEQTHNHQTPSRQDYANYSSSFNGKVTLAPKIFIKKCIFSCYLLLHKSTLWTNQPSGHKY